ncbi:MAG: ribonuclease Y [Deltaproteobacteria bacterium]|nr:ribonuclease Y [Deltaproteobacteria bacterium]
MIATEILLFIAGLVAGITALYIIYRIRAGAGVDEARRKAEGLVKEAERNARSLKKEAELQAKDFLLKAKSEFEKESRERREELQRMEKRLEQKEENIDKKMRLIEGKEHDLASREKALDLKLKNITRREHEVKGLEDERKRQLERLAGMTAEEAKKQLIESIENEARHDSAKRIKQIEDETKEKAEDKARDIICTAIQRYAGEYVSERTVTVVALPNDDMKGRIIGREGRNIRALEAATGIDLIIDDTPEAVILSGFNPVRREVARLALEKLITDGRIHPARIEEIVAKAEKEVERSIKEAGEQATFDVGIHGLQPEVVRLLGSLKYRSSYAQNVLEHSIEVAHLAGVMASELGLNTKQAKRAGLLHDIGKAVDHEVEGSHAIIGANLAKKYRESPKIVNAIAAHHDEEPKQSLVAVLVQAADALSGARPGARREMLESYVKRLEDLEKIAKSFDGVEKSFAIQAGREIRVMVANKRVNDEEAMVLARDMAKKIEEQMTYPGQIRVTVIRETRAVEYAK